MSKIIIRDENGNEDTINESSDFIPLRNLNLFVILLVILIFWRSGVGDGIFFLGIWIFIAIFLIFIEKITIDTGIKCIVIEKRTIVNKKLELKWKVAYGMTIPNVLRI